MRKWGDSAVSAEDMAALDYSNGDDGVGRDTNGDESTQVNVDGLVSAEAMGNRSASGAYEVGGMGLQATDGRGYPGQARGQARSGGEEE